MRSTRLDFPQRERGELGRGVSHSGVEERKPERQEAEGRTRRDGVCALLWVEGDIGHLHLGEQKC